MPLNLSLPSNFSASASGSIQFSTGKKSAPHAKSYVSNGYTMNSNGFLANPSRSAQIAANTGEEAESVFHALTHLSTNDAKVKRVSAGAPGAQTFALV